MKTTFSVRRALLAGTVAAAMAVSGCAVRARYYDVDHRDYHRWSSAEQPHFDAWITDSHHARVEYRKLGPDDQKAYWNWRHDHP